MKFMKRRQGRRWVCRAHGKHAGYAEKTTHSRSHTSREAHQRRESKGEKEMGVCVPRCVCLCERASEKETECIEN